MKKILIVQPIHEKGMELLKSNSNYNCEVVEDLSVENVKQKIIDADAVSLRTSILPAEAIENAKKLKIISRHGVGYDNIDLDSCKKRNIDVAITATANAVAVAEHVLFMLLSISKRKGMYDQSVKSGKFTERNKLPKTIEIWNKNILIAGFGRIGKALIKRCLGGENPFVVWGSPDVVRDFLYVKDVVKGCLLVLEKGESMKPYNVGYGTTVNIGDIVNTILKVTGKTPDVQWDNSKPTTIPFRSCSTERIETELGFKPDYTFEQGMKETIEWYENL